MRLYRRGTAEQADLADALHKMLTSRADHWGGLTEMGLLSIATDGTAADLALVCEELGHHAVRGPVIESLAVAPALLGHRHPWVNVAAYTKERADSHSHPDGEAGRATVAMPPCVPFAADAGDAALVLLVAGGNVYRGSVGAAHSSIDPGRSLHEVGPGELLRSVVPPEAFEMGVLANSAYLLGAGRALLEMSVRHASVREQFGRPVGSNQAVQHRLADVAVAVEFAGPVLEEAAGSLAARDTSSALVACAGAAHSAARAALQVHGAIGYTTEHEMSGYLLRVRALLDAWGTRSWHRERMMRWL
jgi:hypothetical protein